MPKPATKKLFKANRIRFQGKTESKKANLRAKPRIEHTQADQPIVKSLPTMPLGNQPPIKIIGPYDSPIVSPTVTLIPTQTPVTVAPIVDKLDPDIPKPKRIRKQKQKKADSTDTATPATTTSIKIIESVDAITDNTPF